MAANSSSSSGHTAVRLVLLLGVAITLFALIAYYNRNKGTKAAAGNERFSTVAQQQLAPMAPLMTPPAPAGPGPSSASGYPSPSPSPSPSSSRAPSGAAFGAAGSAPSAIEPFGNEKYLAVGGEGSGGSGPVDPFPQDSITPQQLLPKDAANSKWAQANPAGQGDVKDQNFLTAGYHLGFDTQGNSLRNASHDLRSSPANPRYRVSIWQQSTIDPDMSRRPMD